MCGRRREVRVRDWAAKMGAEEPAEWRQRIWGRGDGSVGVGMVGWVDGGGLG